MPHPKITLLNHASVVMDFGEVKLLCDPWFEGTAFSGAWGLQYDNPDAFEFAKVATHLWVSHWHSDHFHQTTLKKLSQLKPDIEVLANIAPNFSMVEAFKKMGFENITAIHERTPTILSKEVTVTTFPAGGIDYMMMIRTPDFGVLNFNDCNIPASAIKKLRKRMGEIDLLMTSYNPSAKQLTFVTAEQTKTRFKELVSRKTQAFSARYTMPFASTHFFLSPYSEIQNEAALSYEDLKELAERDKRVVPVRVGETLILNKKEPPTLVAPETPVRKNEPVRKEHQSSLAWDKMLAIASQYQHELKHEYRFLSHWSEPLRIWVDDHKRMFEIDIARGVGAISHTRADAHISTHSRTIEEWMGRPFGADTFFAGADFAILTDKLSPLRRIMLMDYLRASQISFSYALKLLKTPFGRSFFIHRREEIMAILTGLRLNAGDWRI